MALRECNSGAESSRELFNAQKTRQIFWSALEKKFFGWGCGFFMSDVTSGGLLGHLGQVHLALGPSR